VLEQLFTGVVVSTELLLCQTLMNGSVARAAEIQPLLHLLPGEVLLEPAIAVKGAGDEMMECERLPASAKLAVLVQGILLRKVYPIFATMAST
jgi:hypothetical protein